MSRWFAATAAAVLLLCATPTAFAVDDDTRFLLERLHRASARQDALPAEATAPAGQVRHEGQLYTVGEAVDELEPAIYIALNSSQWERLVEFIARYRALPAHRPALVTMAEALLERQANNLRIALQRMNDAHALEPDDLRIQLELARLLFEDNQDADARSRIQALLSSALPEHTRNVLQQYIHALDQRAAWHGSAAIGAGRNDNVNQANGDHSCYFAMDDGCLFERQMPVAVAANLLTYDVALQQRRPLAGHRNLQLRAVGHGTGSRLPGTRSRLGNHTTTLYAGYQHLDARTSLVASPYLEHQIRDGRSDYLAPGLQLEARRMLGMRWQVGSLLEAKRLHHTRWGERLSGDHTQYQWGLSASYAPQPATTLFGGLDLTRRKHAVAQASSREAALRAGVFHAFAGTAGLYVNAQGVFRLAHADAYDGFLGARRRDRQQVYMASIGAEAWMLAEMVPELRIRRSINQADPYWAFGFRQSEVSLMLRRSF